MYMVIFLGLLWGGVWFWFDSMRAHEIALGVCRRMCEHYELQFLDQALTLQRTRLRRGLQRRWQFEREYRFEFTNSGETREQGTLTMLGTRMTLFELPGYDERVILPL